VVHRYLAEATPSGHVLSIAGSCVQELVPGGPPGLPPSMAYFPEVFFEIMNSGQLQVGTLFSMVFFPLLNDLFFLSQRHHASLSG